MNIIKRGVLIADSVTGSKLASARWLSMAKEEKSKEEKSKKECDSCGAHLHDEDVIEHDGSKYYPKCMVDTYTINTILRKLQKSGHTRVSRRKKNRSHSFLSIVAFWNG